MSQKARVEKLAWRYLDALEEKLADPEITIADIATAIEKLVKVVLLLSGQPIARKEVILKLMGPGGEEVSREYRLVVEETLEKLIGE